MHRVYVFLCKIALLGTLEPGEMDHNNHVSELLVVYAVFHNIKCGFVCDYFRLFTTRLEYCERTNYRKYGHTITVLAVRLSGLVILS